MKKTAILIFLFTSFSNLLTAQSTPKYEAINQNNLPSSDFPKLVNTGNVTLDELNYSIAKENWIALNPRAHEAILNATSVDLLPGFPVKVKTGNSEIDDANFKIAKDTWYNEYPEILRLFYENNAKKYSSNFKKTN